MRLIQTILAISILAALPLQAWAQTADTPGQRLANEMRQTQLLNYDQISGALNTKGRRGQRSSLNLTLRTALNEDERQSVFQAVDPISGQITQLTILRSPNQKPQYFVSEAAKDLTTRGTELTNNQVMAPFVGSNFWIADLGLEFFYWPRQEILRDARIKMRKGISCYVLESRQDDQETSGYTRVRSWISRDHGGLIYAEAYGADGKKIKTFEVSDVEKIDGEWKLKELRIRNEQARSTTNLVFNNR